MQVCLFGASFVFCLLLFDCFFLSKLTNLSPVPIIIFFFQHPAITKRTCKHTVYVYLYICHSSRVRKTDLFFCLLLFVESTVQFRLSYYSGQFFGFVLNIHPGTRKKQHTSSMPHTEPQNHVESSSKDREELRVNGV